MNINCIVNGSLYENCYIINDKDKNALIIDPGSELDKIIDFINNNQLNVVGILITHYHFDHVTILDDVIKIYKCPVVDYKSKLNNKIHHFNFSVIKNYGHTMDSVSFLFKKYKVMFTGDFVFKGSIGNYPYENENMMYNSLKEFIKMDDNIVIYPGHGDKSSIKEEKEYNYFLRGL